MKYFVILLTLFFGFERVLDASEKRGTAVFESIELAPLSQQEFAIFYKDMKTQYVDAMLKAHLYENSEVATVAAEEQMLALLPEGNSTKGQYLFKIKSSSADVGILWYAEKRAGSQYQEGIAWLRWIYVDPLFRRKGYAKAAITQMEMHLKSLGIGCVGLNVFATTPFAKDLYESLGYVVDKSILSADSREIVRYELSKRL